MVIFVSEQLRIFIKHAILRDQFLTYEKNIYRAIHFMYCL